jgi:arylsulfatase A-like enzyme
MIILLYVMDSLRADFLSCYGYSKNTSPHIDRLAQDGVLFTQAFAQSTWTRASGASLLTSRYPSVHTLLTLDDALPATVPTIAEELKNAGFKTIAISAIGNISVDFGFGKGFDHFISLYKEEKVIKRRENFNFTRLGWNKDNWDKKNFENQSARVPISTSEDINEFVYPFLKENRKRDLFILIWSMDTHDPYFHRDPQMARFCSSQEVWTYKDILKPHIAEEINLFKAIYEDMIYYNDHHLGALIGKLKELELFDQTFFILTGDHGESFGEHGANGHGTPPYDEMIRIPLIMKFPKGRFQGRVTGLAQHIDLVPTILEFGGIMWNNMVPQGKSLLPLIRDQVKVNDLVLSEFRLREKLPKYLAIRTDDYKYIEVRRTKFAFYRSIFRTLSPFYRTFFPQRSLFCIREDPGEKVNLIKKEKGIAKQLRYYLKTLERKNKKASIHLKKKKRKKEDLDEGVGKQLKALGYFD